MPDLTSKEPANLCPCGHFYRAAEYIYITSILQYIFRMSDSVQFYHLDTEAGELMDDDDDDDELMLQSLACITRGFPADVKLLIGIEGSSM